MRKISLVSVMLFAAFVGSLCAQSSEKYQALFIYNFTRYIEWPSANSAEFTIGVLGKSSVYKELVTVAEGRKVGTQTIKVKKFASASEIGNCQIVFVSSDASAQVAAIASSSQGNNTLIITERYGLISKGAAINFIEDDGKQKFQMSRVNMQKTGLKVNNQLVNLATLVD